MEKIIFLVLIYLITIGCVNNKADLNIESLQINNVNASGQTIDTTFYFCGLVPEYKNYSYRTGIWNFKTLDGIKFAEGEYDVDFKEDVWKRGGCPYSYYENSVDLKKWNFWDLDGNRIEPTENLINLIDYKAHTEY